MRGLALAAFFAAGLSVASAAQLDPTGQWEVSTGESRYRVTHCGDGEQICARLTWLRDDARTAENLDLLNRNVVEAAKPQTENTWVGTVQYDGKTYTATAKLTGDNSLEVQSCSGMFCRSFTLRRL